MISWVIQSFNPSLNDNYRPKTPRSVNRNFATKFNVPSMVQLLILSTCTLLVLVKTCEAKHGTPSAGHLFGKYYHSPSTSLKLFGFNQWKARLNQPLTLGRPFHGYSGKAISSSASPSETKLEWNTSLSSSTVLVVPATSATSSDSSLPTSSPSSASSLLSQVTSASVVISRLGKRSSSTDSLPNHVIRDSCSDDTQCTLMKTKCMVKQGLCGCPNGYIAIELTAYMDFQSAKSRYDSNESKFCYKLKRNGESCEHAAQCFVPHATCERNSPPKTNNQSGSCQCKSGFNEQAGTEVTDVNGYEITSNRICIPVVRIVNKTYIKITIVLSCLTVAALIACTIIVIKIKRNKRRAQTETAVATTINGPPNHQGQGFHGHRDLGNPPPMGSAEAEFQNDFIQVFPMHHLEPCPEKNMTALIMQ